VESTEEKQLSEKKIKMRGRLLVFFPGDRTLLFIWIKGA
jgi:hypothetical protein